MKTSIVIGVGELGSLFAVGMLKNGYQVTPVLHDSNLKEMADNNPHPDSIWVCVAEKDIYAVLSTMPETWKKRLVLIQNELLPLDWQQHSIIDPTIVSVWFEKKAGKAPQVVLPSVVYGDLATEVASIYAKLALPVRSLASKSELLFELVLKNVYIQTSNIAGLITNGNTRDLVENHAHLMKTVVQEVIQLQETLTRQHFDHENLIQAFIAACYGDPNHNCMGRSAPVRLSRAIALAKKHQLNLPTISDIAAQVAVH
jgi:ketopantoate reductase